MGVDWILPPSLSLQLAIIGEKPTLRKVVACDGVQFNWNSIPYFEELEFELQSSEALHLVAYTLYKKKKKLCMLSLVHKIA